VQKTGNEQTDRFLALWTDIHKLSNGYFSPEGIPYHAPETLLVEAPDHGHETTSEAYSYWIWLEAMYGKVTHDFSFLERAWQNLEYYMIPRHADQPTNASYNSAKPATYAEEGDLPSEYPKPLEMGVQVGSDPIAAELKAAYGPDVYGMHWLMDVDDVYGFGRRGDGTSHASFINTFQRGPQESVWETVPQPCWDAFAAGGANGFLDIFQKGSNFAKQWKYTAAPDADARAIQAVYWAKRWADEQGGSANVTNVVHKASKMGDFARYAFFDKYFKVRSLPHLLVLRLGRFDSRRRRLGLAHRFEPQPFRLPESARRLRALLRSRVQVTDPGWRSRLGDELEAADRVLSLARIRRGGDCGRRDEQLERPLWRAAGGSEDVLRNGVRSGARLPRPAEQQLVRVPGLVDGTRGRVLLRFRRRARQGRSGSLDRLGEIEHQDRRRRQLRSAR
jgi:hypothetical protein